MARHPRARMENAQHIVDRYNGIKAHRRRRFTFDELERLYIGEMGIGDYAPVEAVFQNIRARRGGPLLDTGFALFLQNQYSNKTVDDILGSIRSCEKFRSTQRQQQQKQQEQQEQQQSLALLTNTAPMGQLPIGPPLNQPLEFDFNNGFQGQNSSGQLPRSTGLEVGNIAPMLGMHDQEAQGNGVETNPSNPLPPDNPFLPVDPSLPDNSFLTKNPSLSNNPYVGDDLNGTPDFFTPGPVGVPGLTPDVSACSQPTPPRHVAEPQLASTLRGAEQAGSDDGDAFTMDATGPGDFDIDDWVAFK